MLHIIFIRVFRIDTPLSDWLKDVDKRVLCGMQYGKKRGFLKPGAPVVIVSGWKEAMGTTNTIRVVYVFRDE